MKETKSKIFIDSLFSKHVEIKEKNKNENLHAFKRIVRRMHPLKNKRSLEYLEICTSKVDYQNEIRKEFCSLIKHYELSLEQLHDVDLAISLLLNELGERKEFLTTISVISALTIAFMGVISNYFIELETGLLVTLLPVVAIGLLDKLWILRQIESFRDIQLILNKFIR